MAERRMFAKGIIESDTFLDMPLSAQALYFHLGICADDDGIIGSPKRIQSSIGCKNKDMQLLIEKDFIIAFDSGVVVIKHWKMHNYIRTDRYKRTLYQTEKEMLQAGSDGVYKIIPSDNQETDQMETQDSKEVNLLNKKKETAKVKNKSDKLDNPSIALVHVPTSPFGGSSAHFIDPNELVEFYNANCGNMKKIDLISPEIENAVISFVARYGRDKYCEVIKRAGESDFLGTIAPNGWQADLPWLLIKRNTDKVLDGKYDTYGKRKKSQEPTAKADNNNQQEENGLSQEEKERIYRELTE